VLTGYRYYIKFSDGTEWDYDPNNPFATFSEDDLGYYMAVHDCSYSVMQDPIYTTVHHDAVTHEEPIYETKMVVDQPAWDEQVQELTGYKCSTCGATKN